MEYNLFSKLMIEVLPPNGQPVQLFPAFTLKFIFFKHNYHGCMQTIHFKFNTAFNLFSCIVESIFCSAKHRHYQNLKHWVSAAIIPICGIIEFICNYSQRSKNKIQININATSSPARSLLKRSRHFHSSSKPPNQQAHRNSQNNFNNRKKTE